MDSSSPFGLTIVDYSAFAGFFILLSVIGYLAGRRERSSSEHYFLAGKKLPWYVVGGSFIASNISSEHFIGMIGSACVYGICVAMYEWANVVTFTFLIWLFIPFLLASRVFTIPEFLERRFSSGLRQLFAVVTIITNVVVFLAGVLYGGGLALSNLFGWNLWMAIIALGLVAGVWAIYGGLSSVAWTDLFTVAVMIAGGLMVTYFGLEQLGRETGSAWDGFQVMLERNQAGEGPWQDAVQRNLEHMTASASYNRLSVFQPTDHPVAPWLGLLLILLSVSIWYNVLNQFMIQRVLGAKDIYHARMGIVFAGFLKVLLPVIVTLPGLILFAMRPDILQLPWDEVKPTADRGYVQMLQGLVPMGLRGLFLAALFGGIQSTINSVLNSTATIFTLDIYKRWMRPAATDQQLVRVGVITSAVTLAVAIALAGWIGQLQGSLFEYIQTMNAFFAPPFAAIFLLGLLWRRINATGAMAAVWSGFAAGVGIKLFVYLVQDHARWLEPYANQAGISWAICMVVAIIVSLLTKRPSAEQVSDEVTVNWRKLNLLDDLGSHWYSNVLFWWGLFVMSIVAVVIAFSGLVFPAVN